MKGIKGKVRWMLAAVFMTLLLSGRAQAATPLESHGKLSVRGANILDENGKVFQLKGVSTHGLSWFPEYVSKGAFQSLRDQWGANTVRLAMYTAEYNGYCTGDSANRIKLKKLIDKGVTAATDLGMYVIIDWHILSDKNPNTYKKQSISFFREMASRYKNHRNVIYEICNEPNGGTGWSQIKSYADSVITEIRKADKDAIIVVGTPNWSQDVDTAVKAPIKNRRNIAYSFHFYANTHKESYRKKLESAVKAGLPVLVTEFGISTASGSGGVSKTEGDKWIRLLNKYHIGYVCWNLSNKKESSALIKSSSKKLSGWSSADLTESGKWLITAFKGNAKATVGTSSGTGKGSSQSSTGTSAVKPDAGIKSVKASKKYCTVTLKKAKSWKSGKRYYSLYRMTIKNKSNYKISSWKIRVKFQKPVKKSQTWNGKMSFSGKYVTIKPVTWNKIIGQKGKASDVGFIVSSSSKKNPVKSVVFQ